MQFAIWCLDLAICFLQRLFRVYEQVAKKSTFFAFFFIQENEIFTFMIRYPLFYFFSVREPCQRPPCVTLKLRS